jgi:hypothetical protein
MASSTGAEADASASGTSTRAAGRDAEQRDQGRPDTSSGAAPSAPIDAFRVGCLMNARYHASREAFLDTVHRWFMFTVIMLGAAALIDVVPAGYLDVLHIKAVFGALAAVIAALDLAFDLSNRARVHSLMKRRYFELLADVVEGKRSIPEAEACKNRYAADEEPAYHALLATSWNAAQEMVYGDHAESLDISKWHRFWKNFWRFGGKQYQLKPKSEASEPASLAG